MNFLFLVSLLKHVLLAPERVGGVCFGHLEKNHCFMAKSDNGTPSSFFLTKEKTNFLQNGFNFKKIGKVVIGASANISPVRISLAIHNSTWLNAKVSFGSRKISKKSLRFFSRHAIFFKIPAHHFQIWLMSHWSEVWKNLSDRNLKNFRASLYDCYFPIK